MDIRKFFGSPPSKKPSAAPSKVKEANNNNNGESKRNGKADSVKSKTTTRTREVSEERKTKSKSKEVDSHKKDKKKKPKEIEVIDVEDDVEPEIKPKKPRKSSTDKESSAKKKKAQVSLGDSDDEEPEIKPKKSRKSSTDKESSAKKKKAQVSLGDSDDEEFEEVVKRTKSKRSAKSRKGILYDSDSEEEPIPKKSKRKSSENQSVYIVDSDEDKRKEKKQSPLKAFMTTSVKSVQIKKKAEDNSKETHTPISASDFFGGGSVKRVERKPAAKRKLTEESVKDDDKEIHDDDDFEKTLDQLDNQQQKSKKTRVEKTPEIEDSSPAKSSLSNKLSSLAKSAKVLVEETPDSKSSFSRRSSPRKAVSMETNSPSKTPNKDSVKTPAKEISKTKSEQTPNKDSIKTPSRGPNDKSTVKTPSPDKTPLEKKGSAGYRNYLHREGPQSLGAKEFPQAEPNCLEGLTFVLTGVLESFERDEVKSHLEKYGGKVTQSLSKKTSYVVVGRDAGESKLSKASQFGTKQINEEELLEMVKKRPGKRSKYEIQAEEDLKKEKAKAAALNKQKSIEKQRPASPSIKAEKPSSQSTSTKEEKPVVSNQSEPSLLWVDKYKPSSLKKIIGQTGDKSNANKLFQWLKTWHKNRALGKKPTGGFFGKDDGSGHRAALLSGPPGVGKTTTATLVCQEAGFSYVELNASDTRSKKTLEKVVAESLNNQTLVDFMSDSKKTPSNTGKNHCIIMDEVDGVAGNEDRGGIQELILLIKQTRIPIICICNDRNHQKMRSLVNYCFDLRFYKPRVEQIKGAMMSIIFKEGLNIPPPALNEIILAANQDVRQVLHNLSMWCSTNKVLTYEQAKKDSEKAKKDLKIGPFDVCRKVFEGGEDKRKMSVIDKSDLFFNDYSITPLFVQENYIHVNPYAAKGNTTRHLSQLAKAADSICTGDLIEKKIRSQSKWGLLPMEAIFASVIPGDIMEGGISQMIAFPSWLGKNSSYNKNDRVLQELHTHMSLHISSDKRGLNMDYLPYMRKSLTDPLVRSENEGVKEVISLMDGYNIIKDDFDSIMDVTKWPNSDDPFSSLSSKTKAAFTRAYNKESHMTPYSIGGPAKKKKGRGGADDSELLGEEGDTQTVAESDEDDNDVGGDGMIKMKKPSAASKKTSAKGKSSTKQTESKGKGRGKAKGKS